MAELRDRLLGEVLALTFICASSAGGADRGPPDSNGSLAGSPEVGKEQTVVNGTSLQAMIQAALVDAARTSGVDVSALKVVSANRVVWPNGALGCPKRGMSYTQALIRGYHIRIEAGSQVLNYHAGEHGQPFLCPAGRATNPIPDARV